MAVKIAIIGAGPGGTALARILTQSSQSSKIDITIFEGEKSVAVRTQGGTLDLRQDTGIEAMKAANLYDEFRKSARYDAESMCLTDKNLLKYVCMRSNKPNENAYNPEIDRYQLRRILIESLPEGMVIWGKRVSDINEDSSTGTFGIRFQDGTSASGFDLIIGADGAWSRVRPLLTDTKPVYTGVMGHSWSVESPETAIPEAHDLVNKGSVWGIGDLKWAGMQQLGDGTMQGSSYYRLDDDKNLPYDVNDAAAVRKYNLEKFADWHPTLRSAMEKTTLSGVQTRGIYMLPIGATWDHRPGVTLIGDAAHLMGPFAGEGVNQALTDSKVLGAGIVAALESSSKAQDASKSDIMAAINREIASYEQEMFKRTQRVSQLTWDNMTAIYFTPGLPRKGLEDFMIRIISDGLPCKFITVPLLIAAVYTYFFFFKLWHRPTA